MKKITLGITAHVDSGKTTLAEAMLYKSGKIRSLGRVDNGNTTLDTNSIERDRGITIFSAQAELTAGETEITLRDTLIFQRRRRGRCRCLTMRSSS